ncbi:lipase family protein [Bifidobacterium gallicum]|nr:hypothetical protein [Bifidobacterium gallicum]KFI60143.1 triacylglycerol lipase family protein [Bifidobacterium gallicum DSM 20093 = LMG 11596]
MTPQEAKQHSTNLVMVPTTFLSHFAQMCGQAKERFENDIEIPFDDSWFFAPTNVYNPYMAWSAMGICLTGYKNLPSNEYRYIRKSFFNLGCEDIDISSYYHLNDENPVAYRLNVDQASYAFGHRHVHNTDGTERELVIMMLRGTSDTTEWLSNSEVADSIADGDFSRLVNHEGFWNTAEKAFRDLRTYIQRYDIDMSDARLWVIGHSRGAAIANALAAMIDEDTSLGVTHDRLYAYTFSASRVTMRKDYNSATFDNIFNVINPEDYIPRLPPYGWGIRRFGRDLYLPSIATRYADYRTYLDDFQTMFKQWTHMEFPAFHGNAEINALERELHNICPDIPTMYQRKRFSHAGTLTFAQYFTLFTDLAAVSGRTLALEAADFAKYGTGTFRDFLGFFLRNEIHGHNAPAAHQEEGYLIKLMLCCKYNIDIEQGATPDVTRLSVYGPASITVKDRGGAVVGSISKGRIDDKLYETNNFIAMYVDDTTGEQSVWVPDSGDYHVTLRAETNEPSKHPIDARVSTLDPEGNTLTQTYYTNIALPKQALNESVDWTLLAQQHQGTAASHFNDVDVSVEIRGIGQLNEDEAFVSFYEPGAHSMPIPKPEVVCDALGFLNATAGDHGIIHAHHGRHAKFLGWFAPGTAPKHAPGTDLTHAEPLSTEESYVLPLTHSTTLTAWFEKR